jgi:hypothetical protein
VAAALRSGRPEGNAQSGTRVSANPESGSAIDRSVPIGDLAPLVRAAGVDFVNLQGGAAGRQLAAEYPGIVDATAKEMPLEEFAARRDWSNLLAVVAGELRSLSIKY